MGRTLGTRRSFGEGCGICARAGAAAPLRRAHKGRFASPASVRYQGVRGEGAATRRNPLPTHAQSNYSGCIKRLGHVSQSRFTPEAAASARAQKLPKRPLPFLKVECLALAPGAGGRSPRLPYPALRAAAALPPAVALWVRRRPATRAMANRAAANRTTIPMLLAMDATASGVTS